MPGSLENCSVLGMRKLFTVLMFAAFASPAFAEKWQPLWDGKTFNGWHIIGSGNWEITDGAIRGTHEKSDKVFGHLVTDKTYKDFTVRLKFKALKGNSGFYFRIEEKGASGVSGFQAEIADKNDVGGLYETNGRAWVKKPTPEKVATWFKPGEWNEMTVSARGGDIVVTVNGKKSAELKDDPGRVEGKIALQIHANLDCDIWFKDIEISE
jgi:hypothetical protein